MAIILTLLANNILYENNNTHALNVITEIMKVLSKSDILQCHPVLLATHWTKHLKAIYSQSSSELLPPVGKCPILLK